MTVPTQVSVEVELNTSSAPTISYPSQHAPSGAERVVAKREQGFFYPRENVRQAALRCHQILQVALFLLPITGQVSLVVVYYASLASQRHSVTESQYEGVLCS